MRIKTGFSRKRKHNKVLSRTKGFRMTKRKLYKVGREADLHAGQYAYMGRKRRKRDFRQLWISRLNAALTPYQLSYSSFINALKKAEIKLDRKILADLAVSQPEILGKIIQSVKK